ncbi:ATP synthase F1 subunit gamma [Vallitaleaceae bacterium 9-2]
MASIREIKRRKVSITSTQQITKAMKLVATAKLQKAKAAAESTRPYFQTIHQTISSILAQSEGLTHSILEGRDGKKTLYLVMTSNRGLAGGYNSNIGKIVMNHREENDIQVDEEKIYAIGKRGAEYLRKRGANITETFHDVLEEPTYDKAMELSKMILELYMNKEIDQVYIAYTHFQSTLTQEPKLMKVIPVQPEEFNDQEEKTTSVMNFEPSPEEVLKQIMPKYLSSVIYGALKESVASEHGARMTAMDSATNNANEMIDKLALQYNRARQASITQEITEIVGGAEALQ